MSDNEIIKALESLLDRMRAYESQQASIGKGLVENIISMYDRQKAENERLVGDVTTYKVRWAKAEASKETAKSEARKEFAERLKKKVVEYHCAEVIFVESIDNLVKEMEGKSVCPACAEEQ